VDRNSEPDVTTYVPVRVNADGSFTRLKYLVQPPASETRVTMKDESLGAGGELKYYVYACALRVKRASTPCVRTSPPKPR